MYTVKTSSSCVFFNTWSMHWQKIEKWKNMYFSFRKILYAAVFYFQRSKLLRQAFLCFDLNFWLHEWHHKNTRNTLMFAQKPTHTNELFSLRLVLANVLVSSLNHKLALYGMSLSLASLGRKKYQKWFSEQQTRART